MTERAQRWWESLATWQKTLATLLTVAMSAFGMGVGTAAAMGRLSGIPAAVERHGAQLDSLAGIPAVVARHDEQLDSLVGIPAAMDSVRASDREQGRALNYLACRDWRAERSLDLEYCESILRPRQFLGEREELP